MSYVNPNFADLQYSHTVMSYVDPQFCGAQCGRARARAFVYGWVWLYANFATIGLTSVFAYKSVSYSCYQLHGVQKLSNNILHYIGYTIWYDSCLHALVVV